MWDLPGPGLEPVSAALAGGFLTTAPPGKPVMRILCQRFADVVPGFLMHRPVCFSPGGGKEKLGQGLGGASGVLAQNVY